MDRESPLLTDLYQLNMMQAYLDRGETHTAVFEFFARTLPPQRGFLLSAGLEQALDYLENLRFSADDLEWLRSTGRFKNNLIDYLRDLRFDGDVHAMPEGTAFFAPHGFREEAFHSLWEGALRWNRKPPMAWIWQLAARFASAKRKEEIRRFSGVVLLRRA